MFEGGITVSVRKGRKVVCAILPLCCSIASPALAAQTAASTQIVNTASLAHGAEDARLTVISNTVSIRVDATIDVAITARVDTLAVDGAFDTLPVAFVIVNQGNARESFTLAADAGGAVTVAVDDDGDAAYDPAHDGGTRVTLNPGEQRSVFAIVPGPLTATTRVAMTATAVTGHGAPGTLFTGVGADGVDSIVGASGGSVMAYTTLTLGDAEPSLVKSQSVLAPDGSGRAMADAIITYQLDARFAAPTRGAAVADDVPAGTSFVPGSIMLDGQPQTDAADSDVASFDGTTVRVALGDIAAARTHSIRFQTRIK